MAELPTSDSYDLDRFVVAQEGVYERVLEELRSGQKRSHWMWFVFPQIAGLGSSPTSLHFAIKNLREAQAYARHPLLGRRLIECVRAVDAVQGRSARRIFGTPDDLKFRSSMTLFEQVGESPDVFAVALEKYYGGERDARTLELLLLLQS